MYDLFPNSGPAALPSIYNIFTKIFISPHELNLQVFAAVARDPLLSRCVKELEYDAVDFSPHVTISDYFNILWGQTSMVATSTGCVFRHPDPQICHFVAILKHRRQHRPRSQEIMSEAQAQCCDFDFIREGYRKWMEQAAFEKKCAEENTLLKLLIPGLRKFGRLRTVKLRAEWPSRDRVGREGSPLARSWYPFHAHPGGWVFGPDRPQRQTSPSMDFWTLAFALYTAGKTRIRNLSIESTLPPATFITRLKGNQSHVDCGVVAYRKVEYLKLSLAGHADEPMANSYDNLHGLHRVLESMTALKIFELDLPDDYVNVPVVYFPYTMIFPKHGYWPQLSKFTMRNLAIGTKDLITLLTTKMPSLHHLAFGNINLLDGQWEGIIEYLRVANHLSSFEIALESLLLYHGDEDYLSQRPGPGTYSDIPGYYIDFHDCIDSIENYVVNWRNNPTLKHPSLTRGQPAQCSLDYLHEVFRLCGMHAMGDTLDDLAKHMLNEAARYHKWQESVTPKLHVHA